MIIPELVPGKNAAGLVEYAAAQLGLPYWRGTFGQTATQALLNYESGRFPEDYKNPDYKTQLGLRVHDCCGLVKGYLWCATPTSAPAYNGAQDCDPRMFYENSKVKGEINFETFSATAEPGVCVYNSDLTHIGVWTGSRVIEARGHAYGVQENKLTKNRWKYWSRICFIEYTQEPTPDPGKISIDEPPMIRNGSTGQAVKVWQTIVGANPDGIFGPETESKTKNLQKRAGIEVDGIVGPISWAAGLNTL